MEKSSFPPASAVPGLRLPDPVGSETIIVAGLSNREFLERYAKPGRVGLSGGQTLIDRAICRAERHVLEERCLGAWIALRHPALRSQSNVLSRDRSLYCSAFVHHLFPRIGLSLVPEVDTKNTTPEDLSRTPVPHVTYLLERETPPRPLARLKARVRRRLRARVRRALPPAPLA